MNQTSTNKAIINKRKPITYNRYGYIFLIPFSWFI